MFTYHFQENTNNLVENEEMKLLFLKKIGEIQITNYDGAKYLQLGKLLCHISNIFEIDN